MAARAQPPARDSLQPPAEHADCECVADTLRLAAERPCGHCQYAPLYSSPSKSTCATANLIAKFDHAYPCACADEVSLSFGSRTLKSARRAARAPPLTFDPRMAARAQPPARDSLQPPAEHAGCECVADTLRLAADRPCRHCQYAPLYSSPSKSTCATANLIAKFDHAYPCACADEVSLSFGSRTLKSARRAARAPPLPFDPLMAARAQPPARDSSQPPAEHAGGRCVADTLRLAADRPCRHCQYAPLYLSPCKSTCATAELRAQGHHAHPRACADKVSLSFGYCTLNCARRAARASPLPFDPCMAARAQPPARDSSQPPAEHAGGRCVADTLRLAAERPCRHCQYAPLYLSPCKSTCATAELRAQAHHAHPRACADKVSLSFGSRTLKSARRAARAPPLDF